ncbi:MAG: hypothetical protein HQM16_17995 [Deltaproteobacteria bacterium]|nr:hypothetical protein [Deltaproteobacteria bacterium]
MIKQCDIPRYYSATVPATASPLPGQTPYQEPTFRQGGFDFYNTDSVPQISNQVQRGAATPELRTEKTRDTYLRLNSSLALQKFDREIDSRSDYWLGQAHYAALFTQLYGNEDFKNRVAQIFRPWSTSFNNIPFKKSLTDA